MAHTLGQGYVDFQRLINAMWHNNCDTNMENRQSESCVNQKCYLTA